MPYLDCTSDNPYPFHCITTSNSDFHNPWLELRLIPAILVPFFILTTLVCFYGQRLLLIRSGYPKQPRRKPTTIYAASTLGVTSACIFVTMGLIAFDIYFTRATPLGPAKVSKNVAIQIGWFLDLSAGTALGRILGVRLLRRDSPTAVRYDHRLFLLAGAWDSPKGIWRMLHMQRSSIATLGLAIVACVFTGDVVLRALVAYMLGATVAMLLEICLSLGREAPSVATESGDVDRE